VDNFFTHIVIIDVLRNKSKFYYQLLLVLIVIILL